ncbi:Clan MG, family M24, aminopeptidase P-like metallopeptidase [Tritrichomonas foetus]|uniref:FACT complex subunit n=1 Tax=Tritrichomonas foetus TaxID=1144522 RepID=A0A1J4JVL2_9EUKA|nr:Clan MG, family M24, aminopeptidase P-like metallopeptidase [Tritrichomonas foetus]|eukprot:OHT03177.1 Clan MG, family M24, aminopeptidase P-like metallopeptidase [Tritrichomonas foetus]
MAEPQTNSRFELFCKQFWTEENKNSYGYVLILSSAKSKKPYTIDDALYVWFYQNHTTNTYIAIGHEKVTIFCLESQSKYFSEFSRMTDVEVKTFSSDLPQHVRDFIGDKKVAITSNLEDNDDFSSLSTENVQAQIEEILIIHEKAEQTRCRNGVKVADRAIKKILEHNLVSIIQDHEPMECTEFSHSVASELDKPEKLSLHFKPNEVLPAFPPAVSCGKNISIEFPPRCVGGIPPNIINIAISATVGVRFKSYVGAVGRTYLINATDEQKAAYKAVLKARDECVAAMKVGTKYSEVYEAFKGALDEKYQQYIPQCIGKFAGVQIGTDYHEVSAESTDVVQPNTTIIFTFGLQDYPADSDDSIMDNKFSFQITDTVQVAETEEEGSRFVSSAPVKFKSVAYKLDPADSKKIQEEILNDNTNMAERTRHHKNPNQGKSDDINSKIFQEFKRTDRKRDKVEDGNAADLIADSYKSEKDIPNISGHTNRIVITDHSKTVFLPIYGILVPFHISYIKQAQEETLDENSSYLTLRFEIPKEGIHVKNLYIRELMFTAKGQKVFQSIAKNIRDMRTKYHTELKKQKDEKGLYKSNEKFEKLESNAPRISGSNLHIRPALAGKKSVGNLEAHKNAFRYRSTSGDTIIIMYSNIRLAVFQPSKKETTTLIHFMLNRPIKIANKPTNNITFFKQVVESAVDTSMRSSSMTDQGEIAEEEREARIRKKINKEFRDFCKAVMNLDNPNKPNFEIPQKKLGFYGVPDKSRVFLMPTLNALVSVAEQPAYVLMRDDIQIAIFEHKDLSSRTFDLTFILIGWETAEYNSSISQITTIDTEYFDTIKGWLEAIEVKYYVRRSNLNWKKCLPDMRKNQEAFQDTIGWDDFLVESSSSDETDPENTDDQEFNEDDDEYDDDDDDEEFDAADSDEDDDAPPEDSSDEGEDWQQLEEKAVSYDSRHSQRFQSDDEDVNPRRKPSSKHGSHGHSSHGHSSHKSKHH